MASSRGRRAVQALMLEATQTHVVADDVQYSHHLTEYQHPAAARPLTAQSPQRLWHRNAVFLFSSARETKRPWQTNND